MIIDCRPRFLQGFFRPLQSRLSKPQGLHLWTMILGLGLNTRRAKLVHLAGLILEGRHRTSMGSFLKDADWDASALLQQAVRQMVARLKPRRGEILELIIDDVRIPKRGRKMPYIKKFWDHKEQRFFYGHIFVVAAIRFRGVIMPWRIELWKPPQFVGRAYRKPTQIAVEMIQALGVPKGLKVRVLFDSFYMCPMVLRACEQRGFGWFSVATRNRMFTRDGGRRERIAQLAPGWLRHLRRDVQMPRARGVARLRIAQVDGRLRRIGRVRLVVSKRPGDPWRTFVAFATNERRLHGRKIVSIYENRWSIEVMFKELRSDLGFGDYQVMSEQGIVRHVHLCALAHLMLTHHSLEAVGAQARKVNVQVPLPPMSQRLGQLRCAIGRDQMRRILGGQRHRRLRMRIEPYLMAA